MFKGDGKREKKIKLGKHTESMEGGITVLDRGARECTGKVIFEWRLKGGEGGSQRYLAELGEF